MSEQTENNFDYNLWPDDDVEPNQGLVNEPMAKGRYLLKIAKIEATDFTKGGVPRARLRLRSLNKDTREEYGPPAFIEIYLGASTAKYEGGVKVGDRNAAEMAEARNKAHGRVLGFMKAIGVSLGSKGDGHEGRLSYYNVRAWEGRTFVGTITVNEREQNGLMNSHSTDDPKYGVQSVKVAVAKGAPTTAAAPVL